MKKLIATFAAALACGSPAPQQTAIPLPSATASAPRPPAKRGASPAVASAFVLRAPKTTAYVDFSGFASTKLMSGLLPQLIATARSKFPVDAGIAKCLDAVPAGVKEILFGSSDEGALWIVRYDASQLASPADCVMRFASGENSSAVLAGGVFLFGKSSLVDRAGRGGGSVPPGLDLAEGEYARVRFDEKPAKVDAVLAMSDDRFALRAEADLPEQLASSFAANFDRITQTKPEGVTPEEATVIERIARVSKLARTGNHLAYTFEVDEGVVDQARDLGMVAALAIRGVQKYLIESKQAEAKNVVSAISKNIVEYWEREEMVPVPRGKKRLRSFPPVPKTIPRGVAVQTTPADWAPWSQLKFMLDEPQRYQYEVKAAPDGISADIIARGDLNGDGKPSQFTLHVSVDKPTSSIKIGALSATDPDE